MAELRAVREWVKATSPGQSQRPFPHLPITRGAFAAEQEMQLMWYAEQFAGLCLAEEVKALLKFALLSVLEDISFTSKDGQFLRWDGRSKKVQNRNAKRIAEGKKPVKVFHKRKILPIRAALLQALDLIIFDITQTSRPSPILGEQTLVQGTVLEVLPETAANLFDAVITSPPYCNRYDYTRTYALELAFLGVDQTGLLDLRQRLLSCTVENRSKIEHLRQFYTQIGRGADFEYILSTLERHKAFQEILAALRLRNRRGEVNNSGIISMVEGYFIELAYVTFELFRVCKAGARVAIVNDNVRYSGEIIPVDLLMTDIATIFGFRAEKIYVLPQRKGNSSQQMGKYGREALRKSILIWQKPEQGKKLPKPNEALRIAQRLNLITSALIDSDPSIDQREFDLWRGMAAGSQAQGSWQNRKGDFVETLIRQDLLSQLYRIGLLEPDKAVDIKPRVVELPLIDGRTVRLGSEPDILIYSAARIQAAVEIKGGIDVAGVLERVGASIKSLRRAKEESPGAITILILSAISLSDQAKRDIDSNKFSVNYWFTVEDIMENATTKQQYYSLLGLVP